jgi:hypothetical protein
MVQGTDPLIKGTLSDRQERSAEATLRPFAAFGMLLRCHEPQELSRRPFLLFDIVGNSLGERIRTSSANDVQEIAVLVGMQSV